MIDKKDLIKNYLLEEGLKDEERKIRFEIAWDIRENLEKIKFEIKQDLIKELLKRLENSEEFKGYKIVNRGLIEGKQWGGFYIFKLDWTSDGGEYGILNYGLEAGYYQICTLYIGITKRKDINKNLLENLKKIYETIGGENAGWEVSEWWIAWKYLEEPYKSMSQKEFYTQIITFSGRKEALDYLFEQFVTLKKATEKLIDEFIEIYKKEGA
jgi:hypothetical protein